MSNVGGETVMAEIKAIRAASKKVKLSLELKAAVEQLSSISQLLLLPSVDQRLALLFRQSLLPLYNAFPILGMRLAVAILVAIYDANTHSPEKSSEKDATESWEAIQAALLSGILDFLEANACEQNRTIVATTLYPTLHIFFRSTQDHQPGPDLVLTLCQLLSETVTSHPPNQGQLRDEDVLGGTRIGVVLSQSKGFLAIEALLELFVKILPAKSSEDGNKARVKFIHDVFHSATFACGRAVIDIFEHSQTADWEQIFIKVIDLLASKDVTFPQPFKIHDFQIEKTDRWRIHRLNFDQRGVVANIDEDDHIETFYASYASFQSIKVISEPVARVSIVLDPPPSIGQVVITTGSTGNVTADFSINKTDLQRFILCLETRGLRPAKAGRKLSTVKKTVELNWDATCDAAPNLTQDKVRDLARLWDSGRYQSQAPSSPLMSQPADEQRSVPYLPEALQNSHSPLSSKDLFSADMTKSFDNAVETGSGPKVVQRAGSEIEVLVSSKTKSRTHKIVMSDDEPEKVEAYSGGGHTHTVSTGVKVPYTSSKTPGTRASAKESKPSDFIAASTKPVNRKRKITIREVDPELSSESEITSPPRKRRLKSPEVDENTFPTRCNRKQNPAHGGREQSRSAGGQLPVTPIGYPLKLCDDERSLGTEKAANKNVTRARENLDVLGTVIDTTRGTKASRSKTNAKKLDRASRPAKVENLLVQCVVDVDIQQKGLPEGPKPRRRSSRIAKVPSGINSQFESEHQAFNPEARLWNKMNHSLLQNAVDQGQESARTTAPEDLNCDMPLIEDGDINEAPVRPNIDQDDHNVLEAVLDERQMDTNEPTADYFIPLKPGSLSPQSDIHKDDVTIIDLTSPAVKEKQPGLDKHEVSTSPALKLPPSKQGLSGSSPASLTPSRRRISRLNLDAKMTDSNATSSFRLPGLRQHLHIEPAPKADVNEYLGFSRGQEMDPIPKILDIIAEITQVVAKKTSFRFDKVTKDLRAGQRSILFKTVEDIESVFGESAQHFNNLVDLEVDFTNCHRNILDQVEDVLATERHLSALCDGTIRGHNKTTLSKKFPDTLFGSSTPLVVSDPKLVL